jgi:hypothetical protein
MKQEIKYEKEKALELTIKSLEKHLDRVLL